MWMWCWSCRVPACLPVLAIVAAELETTLMSTTTQGNKAMLQVLVKEGGANVVYQSSKDGTMPLHWYAFSCVEASFASACISCSLRPPCLGVPPLHWHAFSCSLHPPCLGMPPLHTQAQQQSNIRCLSPSSSPPDTSTTAFSLPPSPQGKGAVC